MRPPLSLAAEPWEYLGADEAIDVEHELIVSAAATLRTGDDVAFARAAFELVRDEVAHSLDAGDRRVTWRASDVLRERTGLCYAKAHLYVALLRAGGVEAGLCYQRLTDGSSFFLHGLAAVLLEDHWVRLDPRGNKPGIDVEFSATEDRLAYTARPELGEIDHLTVYATPVPAVLRALRTHDDCLAMCEQGGLPASLDG
ncbi:Transglutaminase-like superfamily protein [Thermomonospora echinospora]|uniref:Transglutaminase-like superfamily protein n=1 Tax=Thermomonospora echinospora TaxID=1992 RepID=A0A1H6BMH9_9ACTN|nr:transglutaminase family protein [Thermomonospora echinospora]SEG61645.1 Transglutaminase-like superfamily protein [Thermomonospora echinospora]